MKKILILILICFAQNIFSQSIKMASDTTTEKVFCQYVKMNPDAVTTEDIVDQGEDGVHNLARIEVKPEFPGGTEALQLFIKENYKTPDEDGLKGKVYVTFIVEKDGSLSDLKVLRDIGYGTGKEAVRVLKKCPKWNPGKQNNKTVRVQYAIPIPINQ